MSLRTRIAAMPETIQEFVGAAEDRYWEGIELLVGGQYHAGIYLLGYVAEMLLKSAYFSFRGEAPTSLVWPMLNPAWRRGADWFSGSFSSNSPDYHNVDFWARLLIEERRRAGRPLPYHLHFPYLIHTSRIYLGWWIEMRYRRAAANLDDAEAMLESVGWLRQHYIDLAV